MRTQIFGNVKKAGCWF